jgi:hypothetical protein
VHTAAAFFLNIKLMNALKLISFFFVFTLLSAPISAQEFFAPSYSFSGQKPSYITLNNGQEMEYNFMNAKREKGLFKSINVKDAAGNKITLLPEDIKSMYLPQSGIDKLAQSLDKVYDAQQWDKIDPTRIKDGYAYFESAVVNIKKEDKTLLMQLLNPHFCNKVKVYFDPYADETTSVALGGITVAGGDAKSYYIAIGAGTAKKLEKKNYEEVDNIYSKCDDIKKKYGVKIKWTELEETLFAHSTCQ